MDVALPNRTMTMQDCAFLAEVEDFLTLCDPPTFPLIQALDDNDKDDDSNPPPPTECMADAIPKSHSNSRYRKKTQPNDDFEAKRALEKARDRKRRSAYRERRRVERETLQQQVGELSKQLVQMEKAKTASHQLSASAMKFIAQRQFRARLSAVSHQRQLIAAIDASSALIKDLRGVARDTFTLEEEEEGLYQHKRMRHGPSGTEFYELCLRDLDTIYTQRDEILRGYGLESTGVDWDSPESGWREEGNTGYFTYVDKYVVPFDFEQTCKSMWDLAHMPHRQEDRQSIDKLEGPEKTAAFTFRVTTHLKSGRVVSIQQRAVIRLYKGDGHGVIVWRSFTEGEGMFTGMHSDETGWMVMIPLPSDPEARTLIKTCIHHKPMHFDRVGTQESTVKQYTDAVLDAVREDGVEITSRLGKLLLDDA